MRRRYPKKFLTTTHYIESQIALEERISEITRIIKEQREIEPPGDCPSSPTATVRDIFSDGRDSFDLSQEPEELEDSIAQWGSRVADRIRCLSAQQTIQLFGGGFVASYVKDFNSVILSALGITDGAWNGILSVALLYIKVEEIPSIVKHWNRETGMGTVPGTHNHPINPNGEWYGCEMVSDAIIRGAIQEYGVARLKSIQALQRAATGSKVAQALTALFASPRFIKAMELSTGMGAVMEMDEVKAAREEITAEVCKIDGLDDIIGIGAKMSQLANRIRTGIESEEEDGADEPEVVSGAPPPRPPDEPPTACPAGKIADPASPGDCIDPPECPEGQVLGPDGTCVRLPSLEESKKITLKMLLEQLNVRGFKGYGSSHAFVDRKPTNLGKSVVEKYLEENEKDIKKSENKKKVKVSKAFSRNKN
tara:strand:+ start:6274 stop:7542 length:1269 start_codon:yes stop_codon:yes gene_type:complete